MEPLNRVFHRSGTFLLDSATEDLRDEEESVYRPSLTRWKWLLVKTETLPDEFDLANKIGLNASTRD